jgi:hypothetical protein
VRSLLRGYLTSVQVPAERGFAEPAHGVKLSDLIIVEVRTFILHECSCQEGRGAPCAYGCDEALGSRCPNYDRARRETQGRHPIDAREAAACHPALRSQDATRVERSFYGIHFQHDTPQLNWTLMGAFPTRGRYVRGKSTFLHRGMGSAWSRGRIAISSVRFSNAPDGSTKRISNVTSASPDEVLNRYFESVHLGPAC